MSQFLERAGAEDTPDNKIFADAAADINQSFSGFILI